MDWVKASEAELWGTRLGFVFMSKCQYLVQGRIFCITLIFKILH